MVQLGGFYGTIQGVQGVLSANLEFFSTFCLAFVGRFLGSFLVSSGSWERVGCGSPGRVLGAS